MSGVEMSVSVKNVFAQDAAALQTDLPVFAWPHLRLKTFSTDAFRLIRHYQTSSSRNFGVN